MSDNGLHFCFKLSHTIYKPLDVRKNWAKSYHPNGSGGVERLNHTMAQTLSMVVNERQKYWDIYLPHMEYSFNNSVSADTGLAPNDVHIGRLLRLPLMVIERSSFADTKAWAATSSSIAISPSIVKGSSTTKRFVSSMPSPFVERHNSTFPNALRKIPQFVTGA